MLISTNCVPKITGDDDGIWRRLHLVPWQIQIPKGEQDPHLRQKLAKERSGVLNWMLAGCIEFQQQGLNPPDIIVAATDDYRQDEDILGAFFDDACEDAPGEWTSTAELKDALFFWFKRNHSGYPPSSRALTNRLKNQGLQDKKRPARAVG